MKKEKSGYWFFREILYIVGDFSYEDFTNNRPFFKFSGYCFLSHPRWRKSDLQWRQVIKNGKQISCFLSPHKN
jgi:hypothetical protein